MTWPLTNDAASEARNTQAPTSSSGAPQRPAGVRRSSHSLNAGSDDSASLSGVRMYPGPIALQLSPCRAQSVAMPLVRFTTAPLVAVYGAIVALASTALTEDTLTILPRPRGIMWRAHACVT